MDKVRIGIDPGGTKIEIIALDHAGTECLRQRVPTPQGDYTAILATIAELVRHAEQTLACHASVGIVVNGKLLSGINAIAGEWGHNPLPWPASLTWSTRK